MRSILMPMTTLLSKQSARNNSSVHRRTLKPMANRPIIQSQRNRNEDLISKAHEKRLEWRTVVSAIMHRYPTIHPDAEKWETEMWRVQEKIEEKQREWLMEQIGGTEAQIIPDNFPSPQEILDSMPFKPASRITEADLSNDRKSLDRRLQDSLYLIVKRNRSDNSWQFPQGKLLDSETTCRSAAERVIDRAVGRTKRWFISNAPIGHYCYEYPAELQNQRKQFGAKVFFYRNQLIAGNVKLETRLYTDYAWIARDEVGEYFDECTAEFLKALLPD